MPASRSLSSCLRGLILFGSLTAATFAASPMVQVFERFHRSASDPVVEAEGGLLLMTELNCMGCHRLSTSGQTSQALAVKPRLSLAEVGSRLSEEAIAAFVLAPAEVKPGTAMPAVATSSGEAQALATYLASLGSPVEPVPKGSIDQGRRIYHQVGCVACHAPGADAPLPAVAGIAPPSPTVPSVPLGLAAHYDHAALARFLIDPLAVRPAGRMPSSGLSLEEAADVAAYLQREDKADRAPKRSVGQPAKIAEGRSLFLSRGCVACHVADEPAALLSHTAMSAVDLATASLDRGCLAEKPAGRAPVFSLDEVQRSALRRAIHQIRGDSNFLTATPHREVERFMARMNCYSCHARGGRGGVEPARARYFEVTDSGAHSLGDMGNLPPTLEHTGRKLTRAWWEKLLWGEGGGVRPYMAARMPKFGREVTEPVLAAWEQADRRAEPITIDTSGRPFHQRSVFGRALMGTQDGGLGCITCHGVRDRKSLGMPVIPLDRTVDRLKPEYFKELLLNPQSVQPGTLMPPMLMGRPKAEIEVEQLWTYLREVDQFMLPDGLLQKGEFELKPETSGKPIVFRTFLDGAGLQAVALGTPVGRHAAFDAADVRWALTWQGRFLDAMTTWEERAATPARPLGEAITALPEWRALARLSSADAPWPLLNAEGAEYRYKGFSVGSDGIPSFHYEVGPLLVDDTLRPDGRSGGYRRTVALRGGTPGWYFRGATAGSVPREVIFNPAGEATLEEILP